MMSSMIQDARLTLRLVARAPLFTAVVVLTIAIGVAATTAIYSAVNAVILAPLPFAQGDRLVSLWDTNPDGSAPRFGVSWPDFRDWRQRTRSFDDMALYVANVTTLVTSEGPESVADLVVTSNFLDVLGIRPIAGRGFGPADERGESSSSVLLSYGYWRRRFGGAASVIGRTITVAGRPRVIVGILPPEAQLLGPAFVGQPLDVMTVIELSGYASVERHAQHLFGAIARLRQGATLDMARADLLHVERQVAHENPEIAGWTASVFRLTDDLSLDLEKPLLILLGASMLLLVIACINVANLLLVRAAARSREMAVRQALGASRGRLAAQLLTESAVLAVIGGSIGVGLAAVGVRAIRGMIPFGVIARADDIGIHSAVLVFALGITLLAALVFGVTPVVRAGGSRLDVELRDRAPTSGAGRVARRVLVVAQVSLALVLLSSAGLVWQSVRRMLRVDAGFKADHVVTAAITLGKDYPDSTAVSFYRRLLTSLEARPGIAGAGATDTPPLGGGGIFTSIRLVGAPPRPPDQPLMSTIRSITPGYFRALGVKVIAGHDLQWDEPSPSIVVSRSAAKVFWPGGSIADRQIAFNTQPNGLPVVGEVNDTRQASLATAPAPIVYVSMRRYARVFHTMTLVVRGNGDAAATTSTIRGALHEIDPALSLYDVRTLESIVAQSTAQPRLDMTLLACFAAAALLLAALGVYGVVSYSVAQRRQEFGVRMALGARPGDILGLVLREGGVMALVGITIGLCGALLAGRLLGSLLYDVRPTDPVTLAITAVGLAMIASTATFIPGRRAARVDPVRALRAGE